MLRISGNTDWYNVYLHPCTIGSMPRLAQDQCGVGQCGKKYAQVPDWPWAGWSASKWTNCWLAWGIWVLLGHHCQSGHLQLRHTPTSSFLPLAIDGYCYATSPVGTTVCISKMSTFLCAMCTSSWTTWSTRANLNNGIEFDFVPPVYSSKWPLSADTMAFRQGLHVQHMLLMKSLDMPARSSSIEALRSSTDLWGVAQAFLSMAPQML